MTRFVRPVIAVAAVAAAWLAPAKSAAAPVPLDKPKDIDLVLCLDVSNSMDGLIDSAKLRLWDVVNDLAKVKPTPNLRVALYSYGHDGYSKDSGWVRKEVGLTTDLDDVSAKLHGLKTNGGTELVARVTKTALNDLKWSEAKNALKVIFVCGNEPADQDKEVSLTEAAALARNRGVIVNTIYCGSAANPEVAGWRDFGTVCSGAYTVIDQDRARKDAAAAVKTPFDADLLKLNDKLNGTYVAYGPDGPAAAANQAVQDGLAAKSAGGAALARAESKANALYRNGTWDLVDRAKDDPKFDVNTIKDADLPEDLRKLKPADRPEYLKKKAAERAAIQKDINDLSAKRAKMIEEERKKLPQTPGEKALDEALKTIIRTQAKAKGFEPPAAK